MKPAKPFKHDYLFKPFIGLVPHFVTPNSLTAVRFILIPILAYVLFREWWLAGMIIFIVAALTDALDGTIARLRNKITKWGIFNDPVADKLLILVTATLVLIKSVPLWITISLFAVELMIVGGGWYRKKFGDGVKSANWWGKAKMIFEVIGISFALLGLVVEIDVFFHIAQGTLIAALALAVISLFTYSL